MPLPYANEFAAVLLERGTRLTDQIVKKSSLLSYLRDRQVPAASRTIRVPLYYKDVTTAAPYKGLESIAVLAEEQIMSAKFDIAQYAVTLMMAEDDVEWSRGEGAILPLLESRERFLVDAFGRALATDLWGTAQSTENRFEGIRRGVTAASAYGQVLTSDMPEWKTLANASAVTLNNKNVLETGIVSMKGEGIEPSVGFSPANIWGRIAELYNDVYRLVRPSGTGDDRLRLVSGYVSINVMGVEFYIDPFAPASHLILIEEGSLSMPVHPRYNFSLGELEKPFAQEAVGYKMKLWAQVICHRRKGLGGWTNMSL